MLLQPYRLIWIVLPLMSLSLVTGCASAPRYSKGVEWIVSMEAQKKQLNDAGFPQYPGIGR